MKADGTSDFRAAAGKFQYGGAAKAEADRADSRSVDSRMPYQQIKRCFDSRPQYPEIRSEFLHDGLGFVQRWPGVAEEIDRECHKSEPGEHFRPLLRMLG
jgi:hypothetical protein